MSLSVDPAISRRSLLALTAASAAGLTASRPISGLTMQQQTPVPGAANRDLQPFDDLMTSFIAEHKVPGASLAVTRNGKLVYARGFGYADVENAVAVQPADLFRIASVSKPITAVAIMQLVEQQKLKLDDKVVPLMKLKPLLAPQSKADPRWEKITVRHCLQHTGGWDRDKSYDPIVKVLDIAKAFQMQPPVTPAHVVRYMMGQPLDFDPGERYAYANVDYLVLGRIVEAATGQKYDEHVKQNIFAPLGVKSMQLGRALIENRAEREVKYYDRQSRTGAALLPPKLGEQVPVQYGAENLEAYEAHGGWIASAVDLVKFAAAFDNLDRCPLLKRPTIDDMWSRPAGLAGMEADGTPKPAYYGCGWLVRPVGDAGKVNAWHTGRIAGTESLLVRRWDGLDWAVLFNTALTPDGKSLSGLIDPQIHVAADKVKTWPEGDQFGDYLKYR